MALSRDSRLERKTKFLLRKQLQVKQGLERIDFEEDVLIPIVEALKAGKSVLGLPDGAAFDFVLEDANPHPPKDTDADDN